MEEYLEHEKLHKVADESQRIGEFLDWLNQQGINLMRWVEEVRTEEVEHLLTGKMYTRNVHVREWQHTGESIQALLARYFEIDLDKIDAEKRAMLAAIRRDRNGATP